MRHRPTKAQFSRIVGPSTCLGALALALVTFAPAAARAEDDEDKSIWNLDKRIINEVLYSFGLTKKPHLDQQIDYQERPRLTVPSDHQLPAPQAVAPKTVRRQQKPKADWRQHDPDEFTNPIHPGELRANSAAVSSGAGSNFDPTDPLRPSQLGSSGGFFGLFSGGSERREVQAAAAAPAPTGEPPRRNLIDPPPGYQVPSPTQPYGGTRAGSAKPKPTDHALGDDQGL
jgi:hypothetical protein